MTYMAVVLAAHGLRTAAAAKPAPDNGDRGAVQAEEEVEVLHDDAKEA